MISFTAYLNMVRLEEKSDLLYEMATLTQKTHGIPDAVIWVGRSNKRHGLRVKVSLHKNKWVEGDDFVIQMPSLDYDYNTVPKWMSKNTLDKIKKWIVLNTPLLNDYQNGNIHDTSDFLNGISKI